MFVKFWILADMIADFCIQNLMGFHYQKASLSGKLPINSAKNEIVQSEYNWIECNLGIALVIFSAILQLNL